MERLGERTRDIRFYSNKNGDIVCLHSKWARNYARWLEEQAWVQSYQVGCPLDAGRAYARTTYRPGGLPTLSSGTLMDTKA